MATLKNNEFGYLGNPNVKRDGVEAQFTLEEIKEYKKCMQDPAYFATTYVKIISLTYMIINKKCLIILMIIDFLLY